MPGNGLTAGTRHPVRLTAGQITRLRDLLPDDGLREYLQIRLDQIQAGQAVAAALAREREAARGRPRRPRRQGPPIPPRQAPARRSRRNDR